MKVNIKHYNVGFGNRIIITDEPYRSAMENIIGLSSAPDTIYHEVCFGSDKQQTMTIHFGPTQFFPKFLEDGHPDRENWHALQATGEGIVDVPQVELDRILSVSAAIDEHVAAALRRRHIAMRSEPTYRCAGYSDGCPHRVLWKGTYCSDCEDYVDFEYL